MAKKFTLAEKPCTLGSKFVTTGEGEGDEPEAKPRGRGKLVVRLNAGGES
jgi:hypothetical protein